jgi:hypothetical protein
MTSPILFTEIDDALIVFHTYFRISIDDIPDINADITQVFVHVADHVESDLVDFNDALKIIVYFRHPPDTLPDQNNHEQQQPESRPSRFPNSCL